LAGKAYYPKLFSERFLRKRGIFKKIAISVSLSMARFKLGPFPNYNMLLLFLDLVFTTLEDIGEMMSRDLLVQEVHWSVCQYRVACKTP